MLECSFDQILYFIEHKKNPSSSDLSFFFVLPFFIAKLGTVPVTEGEMGTNVHFTAILRCIPSTVGSYKILCQIYLFFLSLSFFLLLSYISTPCMVSRTIIAKIRTNRSARRKEWESYTYSSACYYVFSVALLSLYYLERIVFSVYMEVTVQRSILTR